MFTNNLSITKIIYRYSCANHVHNVRFNQFKNISYHYRLFTDSIFIILTCALSEKLRKTPICSIWEVLTHFLIMWPSPERYNEMLPSYLSQFYTLWLINYTLIHRDIYFEDWFEDIGCKRILPPGVILVGSMLSGENSKRSLTITHSRFYEKIKHFFDNIYHKHIPNYVSFVVIFICVHNYSCAYLTRPHA